MKVVNRVITFSVFVLVGCGTPAPEELVREIKFEACEKLRTNSVWGDAKAQAEKECAAFVGLVPEEAVGQTDIAQALGQEPSAEQPVQQVASNQVTTGGSNNSLLYYMVMRDTFMGANSSAYNRYSLGANHLSSPMGMSYGVKRTPQGTFEVPKFGNVNPASRISSAVPVNSYSNGISKYSRGAMSSAGHK